MKKPQCEMRMRPCSCIIGSEAAGKHLYVSVQQRGEGQAAVQCSTQLLSKLVFLSVSPPVSLSPVGWACSV